MTDEIRTERLLMRRWRDEDREPFAVMNADPRVMRFFPATLTRDQSDAFVERIDRHFDEHGYGLWALEAEGRFIGTTGLQWATWESDVTPAVEVGWRLAADAWGNGYASEAATAALVRGFAELDSVVSFTAALNEPSQRVMQRIGMRFDGPVDYPRVPDDSPLKPHVVYRADRDSWTDPRSARTP